MKNRIFVTILLALLMSKNLVAEELMFFNTDKASKFLECDVHAIVGTSVLSQDYADHVPSITAVNVSPGCGGGIGASVQFAFKDFFAIGTGLDLMAINNKYSMALIDVKGSGSHCSAFVSNQAFNVTVPLYVSVRFNVASNVRWNVDGGIYLGLGIGGTQKADTYTTTQNELGQIVTKYQHYKWDYYNETHPIIHTIDDVDWGLIIGTNLLFHSHYKVGIEARVSTKNATADKGIIHPNVYNHLFAMKIGYQF